MTTFLSCEGCGKRYSGMNIHKAARMMSSGDALPRCPKCQGSLAIKIRQVYPLERASGRSHEFAVDRVSRVYSDENAEKQDPPFDPMMFFIHEIATGRQFRWPVYWTKNEKGNWAWGQYSPMMTPDELGSLLK